jgi:hypothetical protein
MLDDAFKLTIDRVFPNPKEARLSTKGSSSFKGMTGFKPFHNSQSKKRDASKYEYML